MNKTEILERLNRLESRLESHQTTIQTQQQLIEAQRDRIAALENQIANQASHTNAQQTPSKLSSIQRRSMLATIGLTGLLGLGTGVVSGDPQGQIGTAEDPVKSVYTQALNGGLTNDSKLTSLTGDGLTISDGKLTTSGPSTSNEYEYTKAIHEEAERVGTKLREAVVVIRLDYSGGSSSGTGWFIDDNKILTNAHVVSGLKNRDPTPYVWTLNGNQVDITLEKYATGDEPDLALLKTTQSAPHVPDLGKVSNIEEGDKLVRVGHPSYIGHWAMGLGELLRNPSNRDIAFAELPYGGGHSGSPVITLDGKVIGTSHATSDRGEYIQPDERPPPVPANIKPEYDHESHTKIRTIKMEAIQRWMPE